MIELYIWSCFKSFWPCITGVEFHALSTTSPAATPIQHHGEDSLVSAIFQNSGAQPQTSLKRSIRNTFLTSFYQRAGAHSPPKTFDKNLSFASFIHDFNICVHFVKKNFIKSNGKLSNCLKPINQCRVTGKAVFTSFKPAKPSSQIF